jgi:holliday junction DNA helicase RuvA
LIAYLRGKVLSLDDTTVTLEVHGIGYEVMMPAIEMKTLRARLHRDNGAAPEEIALHIYYHVNERQPTPILIGFTERQSREFFRALLTVAEVGPALAAKAMTIAVCEFASAIERRDVRMLGTLPGIGKRKADQIVATLKGKVLQYALLPAPELLEAPAAIAAADFVDDVSGVLQGLGHKRGEAEAMIRRARQRRPDIAEAQALLEEIWRGESGEKVA